MAINESFKQAGERERNTLHRITEQMPLFRVESVTSTNDYDRYDAMMWSATSLMTTEFKFRTDLSNFNSVFMDLAKWKWLANASNPMFIVYCSATTNVFVWDLSKAEPMAGTKWVRTPARNDQPNGPHEWVECVRLKKSDADHIIKLNA